ncbi:zinc ribbon domain-containing protein [Clostridium sp. Marseille-P299]|uniref:zinc ribbon domain-containing protein n=1 Tax=Clostridium sp. Marseille-P299 TaxID=1805477 RepID=UPI00082ECC28|nr:zinc ribbon domain-containing protein [Clostridium sp. Marseille-P299]
MQAKELYLKTMKFVWLKLALGLGVVLLSIVWLAICFGIGALFGGGIVYFFAFLFWIGGTGVINSIITHYFGYLVKAGHVAILAEAVTTGQIPEKQFEVATARVKERFGTSNVYFVIDKLISASVKQIQGGLDTVDSMLGNLPGVGLIIGFSKVLVSISLGYVDECCLGYTFYKKDQNAYKSAADGVVIYFQNWKSLLKSALGTALVVILVTFAFTLIPFLLFGAIFTALNLSKLLAFFLAVLVALSIKSAFIDSYVLTKTMVSYMKLAPETQITFNLYDKLCKLSSKFKELFGKANVSLQDTKIEEEPTTQTTVSPNVNPIMQQTKLNGCYCDKCGTFNSAENAFCSSCGNKLESITSEQVTI